VRARLRRHWLVLHRWVGLSFGCVLLLAAITGILLIVARPIDQGLHPGLFRSTGTSLSALDPIVSRLRAEFGPRAAFDLRLPARPGDALQVRVTGPWNGTIFLDPSSGHEGGRRQAGEGLVEALFELHSTLYAGASGRALLSLSALAYAAMLVSGLVLWWPARWRQAFSLRTRSGWAAGLFDVHRVAGAVFGLLVLVSVATGAYMAWRPLAGWVNHVVGQSPAPTPAPQRVAASTTAAASLEAGILRAKAQWPGAVVSIVHVAPGSLAAARVRLRLLDDPHPIGMSTVWLDVVSGQVRLARRWSELDPGTRAYSFMYPLHTGELVGSVTLLITLAAGGALAGYGTTGLWLWCRRRALHRRGAIGGQSA